MLFHIDRVETCAAWLHLQAESKSQTPTERQQCADAADWLTAWAAADTSVDVERFLLSSVAGLVARTARVPAAGTLWPEAPPPGGNWMQ